MLDRTSSVHMEKVVEHLYDLFLYRDILSYAVPGAIALWAAAVVAKNKILISSKASVTAFVLAAYLTGLLLQATGTLFYEKPWWPFLRHHPVPFTNTGSPYVEQEKSIRRMVFESIPPQDRGEYAMKRLERFAALKQIHGNTAMAMLVVTFAMGVSAYRAYKSDRNSRAHRLFIIGSVLSVLTILIFFVEHSKLVIREQTQREVMVEAWKAGTP